MRKQKFTSARKSKGKFRS